MPSQPRLCSLSVPKTTQSGSRAHRQTQRNPLPKWEIERANGYRAILDTLIEESNKTALVLQQEMREEIVARQAAREAAAPPKPAAKPPNPKTAPFRPDLLFKTLVQTIESCIRLDAWLAARLTRGHTEKDLASLAHPDRPDIHTYIHNAARTTFPDEDRTDLHKSLEAWINQTLALFPDRNPGDIIAEICHLHDLAYNEADFPNNWRIENFTPPVQLPWDEDDIPPESENPHHPLE